MPSFRTLGLACVLLVSVESQFLVGVQHKTMRTMKPLDHRRSASSEASLKGDGGDYAVPIIVGNSTLTVTLDTGSSTFAVARCGHDLPVKACYSGGTNLDSPVSDNYASGNWTGDWYEDTVSFGGVGGLSNDVLAAVDVHVAGITDQYDFFFNNAAGNPGGVDGILGLAYAALSNYPNVETTISSLIRQNDLENTFSLYLCPATAGQTGSIGYMIVGAGADYTSLYDTSEGISWTPIQHPTYYTITIESLHVGSTHLSELDDVFAANYPNSPGNSDIIDSGYSSLGLQTEVFEALTNELVAQGFGPASLFSTGYSATLSPPDLSQWPKLTFTLSGGTQVSVSPEHYVQPLNTLCSTSYSLAISDAGKDEGNALGNPLFNDYFVIFERDNNRIGFAPMAGQSDNCDAPATPSGTEGCDFNVDHRGGSPSVPYDADAAHSPSGWIWIPIAAGTVFVAAAVAATVVLRRRRAQRQVELLDMYARHENA